MEPTADQNLKEPEKRGPNIRTMKSDISEFLANTKPSLVQILTTQVEAERAAEESPKVRQTARIFAVVGVILIVGTLGYLGYRYFRPSSSEEAVTLIPQPFFSVDKSVTIEYKAGKSLTPSILDNARVVERRGVIKRLVVLGTSTDGRKVSQLATETFLKAAGVEMPNGIYPALADILMPLYYRGEFGTRLAFVIKTNDPARAFDQLLRNEPELANWWSALFLGEKVPTRIIPFEDRTYKNISYRILALEPSRDLQMIYAVFPAKNYLIIASSEEALRVILSRLFQAS